MAMLHVEPQAFTADRPLSPEAFLDTLGRCQVPLGVPRVMSADEESVGFCVGARGQVVLGGSARRCWSLTMIVSTMWIQYPLVSV